MPTVLITGALTSQSRKQLEDLGLKISLYGVNDLVKEDTFIEAIKDIDIYICGGYEISTKAILEAANALKLIVFLGTECSAYIDLATAFKKQIQVCNTPGANAQSVAEFTVGLIIDSQRRISLAASPTESTTYGTYHTLHGKTLGLIGYGNIGSRVAKICAAGFDMKIQYWTRSGAKQNAKKLGAKFVEIDELLASSDVISLHVPTEAGVLIDAKRFNKIKRGSILINTSRASLCDADALLEALSEDNQMYAAFDGAYEETTTPDKTIAELHKLIPKQFLVTPHVAWRTYEADEEAYNLAVDSIVGYLKGLKPINLVKPAPTLTNSLQK